jgi:HEPN domain-containing protein
VNNQDAAHVSLRRAEVILEEARELRKKGVWNLVVRRSQEAVETALKVALLWACIQAPHVHDIGPILRTHSTRFPESFASIIPRLASISRSLRGEREKSFYGDEESNLPPETLYGEEDAGKALEKAAFVIEQCRQLIVPFG